MFFNDVGMLLPMDSEIELITNATITTYSGTPSWGNMTQTKFGGSLYLNGSSSVRIDDANVQDLGDAWTIEMWVYANAWGGPQAVANAYLSGTSSLNWAFHANDAQLTFLVGSGNDTAFDIVPGIDMEVTEGSWHHIAGTWDGTTYRAFTNGVLKGSVVSSTPMAVVDNFVVLGSNPNFTAFFFNGYIDDFRITKNVARYVGNFNPPAVAFPTSY